MILFGQFWNGSSLDHKESITNEMERFLGTAMTVEKTRFLVPCAFYLYLYFNLLVLLITNDQILNTRKHYFLLFLICQLGHVEMVSLEVTVFLSLILRIRMWDLSSSWVEREHKYLADPVTSTTTRHCMGKTNRSPCHGIVHFFLRFQTTLHFWWYRRISFLAAMTLTVC